jgi:hypothetical protein
MESKEFGCWTLLYKYDTKAAREKMLDELDELESFIVA